MKTKVIFLMILFITTVSAANAKDKKLLGTWKAVNEESIATGFTQIKSITPTHFMWVSYGPYGRHSGSCAGTQDVKDGKYIEFITTNSQNPDLIGAKGINTYKIKKNRMTIKGVIEKKGVILMNIEEVWEKID